MIRRRSLSIAPLTIGCCFLAPAAQSWADGDFASDTACTRAGPPRTWAYDCEGAQVIAHTEASTGELTLFLPGRTVRLPRVASGSGSKYGDGNVVFWSKGTDEALLLDADGERRCRVDRRRSLREEAKLRGVDYRGTGNEPGWVLELGPERIFFEYDYAESRACFPLPKPVTDAATRRTVYAARGHDGEIEVRIRGESCRDDMSGEPFGTRLEIAFGGHVFRGCGDALH